MAAALALLCAQAAWADEYGRAGDPQLGPSLFAKALPLLRDPRCLNCHGKTNPFTGENHGGGNIQPRFDKLGHRVSGGCESCHSALGADPLNIALFSADGTPQLQQDGTPALMSEWRIPPPALNFTGRSDQQLCRQVAALKVYENLMVHYQQDARIALGLQGRKAMDIDPLYGVATKVEPPLQGAPTTLQEQTQLVSDWWKKGYGACGFVGTVEVQFSSVFNWPEVARVVTQEKVIYTLLPDGRVRFDGRHDNDTEAGVKWDHAVGTDLTLAISLAGQEHGSGSGFDAPVQIALDETGGYIITWSMATFPVDGHFLEILPIGAPLPVAQDSYRTDIFTKDGTAKGKLARDDGLHLRGTQTTTKDSSKVAGGESLPPTVETLTVTWDLTIQ